MSIVDDVACMQNGFSFGRLIFSSHWISFHISIASTPLLDCTNWVFNKRILFWFFSLFFSFVTRVIAPEKNTTKWLIFTYLFSFRSECLVSLDNWLKNLMTKFKQKLGWSNSCSTFRWVYGIFDFCCWAEKQVDSMRNPVSSSWWRCSHLPPPSIILSKIESKTLFNFQKCESNANKHWEFQITNWKWSENRIIVISFVLNSSFQSFLKKILYKTKKRMCKFKWILNWPTPTRSQSSTNGDNVAVAPTYNAVHQMNDVSAAGPSQNVSASSNMHLMGTSMQTFASTSAPAASASSTISSNAKRFKIDTKFDVDDTCSNDAFIYNTQRHTNANNREHIALPHKNPKLAATAIAYDGLK